LNLGGNSDTGSIDITVGASPVLPESATPDQITLEVPKRFKRSGDKAETEFIDLLQFSTPRIINRGSLIGFSLCVDPDHLEAGSYVGQVIVGGPVGVEPATLAVTVNKQNGTLFWVGWAAAGLLAGVLLLLQAARTPYDEYVKKNTGGNTKPKKLWKAIKETVVDVMGFVLPALIGIALALAAMYQIYAGDPAWGADSLSSVIALVGTAITAAGLGAFISSIRKSGS
jgi:hypothetical protein